jgi:hypothetical protein
MRVLLMLIFTALFCGAQSAPESKSSNSAVRVCIASPVNLSHLSISPAVQRDRLTHYINTSAQKKNAPIRVDAIAVEGSDPRDASDAAHEKECRYLVLSEFQVSRGYTVRSNGASTPDPMMNGRGELNNQRAALNYRIVRVGGTSKIADGFIALPAEGDEDSAATDGMRQLSVRVVHEVTKERPPAID